MEHVPALAFQHAERPDEAPPTHASQDTNIHAAVVRRGPRSQQQVASAGLRVLDQEERVVARQRFAVEGERGRPPSVGEDRCHDTEVVADRAQTAHLLRQNRRVDAEAPRHQVVAIPQAVVANAHLGQIDFTYAARQDPLHGAFNRCDPELHGLTVPGAAGNDRDARQRLAVPQPPRDHLADAPVAADYSDGFVVCDLRSGREREEVPRAFGPVLNHLDTLSL
ncbi:unnamed protein product [Pelagomonas calceolata]|uniref:Uncharacterized protein n=1 Tax=Pelagomonas calceolata TaxID=35677 RepID=A0A8J2SJF6_9STRA|nr:unnamed protein product [Pelagomonas calceolata]